MSHLPAPSPRRRHARQHGFGLLDVLGAVVILGLGLMAQAAGAISEQRLAKEQESRSQAHQALRQFMERMRSDENWVGMYSRLRSMQVMAGAGGAVGGARLDDGRAAFSPSAYYSDFEVPPDLGAVAVLVDVPRPPPGAMSLFELREDLNNPRLGLPADLNGDGLIDALSHVDDYEALPVIVTFQWTPPGESTREIRASTWLRGDR